MPDDKAGPPSRLVVEFRWLAAAGAIISLALAATLVVTTRSNGSDVLATIALALAILAFVVQLIVFIVQTTAASQQMLQSAAAVRPDGDGAESDR
ncbi:MAG TPA: hypothetical protein VN973_06005 [Candidatus Dormibacteraeota bacterium]|nr:hypothetical protein [Candidatus Dormibacteraeota bacterium]